MFSDSLLYAKKNSQRLNHVVNANQELIALGFTNIICSFFGCFPVFSSMSRGYLV